MVEYIAGMMRNAHKILVREYKGKKAYGKFRHRRDKNIKMYLEERKCELDSGGSGWIHLLNMIKKPSGSI
jgi:hypothetical protein